MIAPQSLRRIAIVGDGMRAAMTAAYLTKACRGAGTKIGVISTGEAGVTGDVIARPSALRFNTELGIDPAKLCQQGIASPLFVADIPSGNGFVSMPYAPSGVANNGVDFHHYWLRASEGGFDSALRDYSLSLTLHSAKHGLAFESAASFNIPFGLRINRAAYAQLLVNVATLAGAQMIEGELAGAQKQVDPDRPLQLTMRTASDVIEVDADFLIDVSDAGETANTLGVSQSGWTGNCLRIDSRDDVPGVEIFRLQRALSRFASLIPEREGADCDSAEFNRIFHAEEDRIVDMVCLLSAEEGEARKRAALARKIDVFTACGRIPSEDYEVFQPCEWLAALMSRGYLPKRAERLAERLPQDELHIWLGNLRSQISDLRKQVEAA